MLLYIVILYNRNVYKDYITIYSMTKQSNNMKESIKCKDCGSTNIIKWCKRKTQNRGYIQRYKCKDCEKYFTIDDGFFRMRNNSKKITLCLDLFFKGISTRQVQEHLQAFYPNNSSNVSIYNWVIKYSKKISKFLLIVLILKQDI